MAKEEFQRVREPVEMEGMLLEPERPLDLLLSNIMRRVILWGYASAAGKFLQIAATDDGELKVDDAASETLLTAIAAALAGTLTVDASAQVPDAFKRWGVTSGDAWSGYQAFGFTSRVITIICETNAVTIQFKDKDGVATDVFELPADTGLSLDLKMTEYRHVNKTAGSNAFHQLIASYVS